MTNFLKTASGLTGSNYQRLQNHTDKSRTKVVALGMAILIPSVLWMGCSFLLAYQIMQASFFASIAIALLLGFVILTIERLVVMGNGHWVLYLFRLVLALVVAGLGSLLFDLVFFKNDIELQLPSVNHEMAMHAQNLTKQQFEESNGLPSIKAMASRSDSLAANYQQQAIDEASGLGGSGIKGAASATIFKQQQANKAKADAGKMIQKIDELNQASAAAQQAAYDSAKNNFDDKSILFRMKAMEQLLTQHSEMKTLYWLFTSLLFIIELLVVVFKITWPKTAYEKEIDMLDALHQKRTEMVMQAYQAPHHMHPQAAQKSRQLLNNINTLL